MAAQIPYDILGLVLGLLGVAGLIPLLWVAAYRQLPRHRLKQLDAVLEETTTLLDSAIQDGFVPNIAFVYEVHGRLRTLRSVTENLRVRVLRAAGSRRQLHAALNGLSRKLNGVCSNVQDLRIRIATVSELERLKAEAEGRCAAAEMQNIMVARLETRASQDDPWVAGSYVANEPASEVMEMSTPEITIPPPSYTAHTPNIYYQAVRHDSGLRQLKIAPDCSEMACRLHLSPRSVRTPYASPGRPSHNHQNMRIYAMPESKSAPAPLDQIVTTTSGKAMISDLQQQILVDMHEKIATLIQSTLELHLLGVSLPHSLEKDLEAGICPQHCSRPLH